MWSHTSQNNVPNMILWINMCILSVVFSLGEGYALSEAARVTAEFSREWSGASSQELPEPSSPYLNVYPAAAAELLSSHWRVAVEISSKGTKPEAAAVYESAAKNRDMEHEVDDDRTSSWCGFSFSGGTVTVYVTKATRSNSQQQQFGDESIILRPVSLGLTAHSVNSSTIAFDIPPRIAHKGYKISVEAPSMVNTTTGWITHSLMIFADPPEHPDLFAQGRKDPDLSSTMYFGPGVHDLNGQLVLPPNIALVYIAPGAWIDGGFITASENSNVTIAGRGVISGRKYPFLKGPAGSHCYYNGSFCWSLINLDKGTSHLLDGVTLADPPKYYFRSYAAGVHITNVKMVAACTVRKCSAQTTNFCLLLVCRAYISCAYKINRVRFVTCSVPVPAVSDFFLGLLAERSATRTRQCSGKKFGLLCELQTQDVTQDVFALIELFYIDNVTPAWYLFVCAIDVRMSFMLPRAPSTIDLCTDTCKCDSYKFTFNLLVT
eukprot:m.791123 g.791123  ORF g.791123 m.791123 type:complete len:491 (-) comp23330_c1_seq6:1394-2866(-)